VRATWLFLPSVRRRKLACWSSIALVVHHLTQPLQARKEPHDFLDPALRELHVEIGVRKAALRPMFLDHAFEVGSWGGEFNPRTGGHTHGTYCAIALLTWSGLPLESLISLAQTFSISSTTFFGIGT
jgi:hypothetical protein